jgi:hypothetical protein
MPLQQRLIVVMPTIEVAEQARSQPLDLVFRQVHDAVNDLSGPRMANVQLLARQEEPRDDAGRIGVQSGLNAVRDHSGSLI